MLENARIQKLLSGEFPVKWKMELVSGEISGAFPVIHRKTPEFHVFCFIVEISPPIEAVFYDFR